MTRSLLAALVVATLAVAWVLTGDFTRSGGSAPAAPPSAQQAAPVELAAVRVARFVAETYRPELVVTGRTEANRRVDLRAETDGRVVEIGVSKGTRVKAGDLIARLALEERNAQLAEANALLAQREIEYAAARELARKGFRSDTSVAAAKAQNDAAKAMVERMRVDIARTAIRAPFAGVLDSRDVELGTYLKAGDQVARIVDIEPVLAIAHVVERHVGAIATGGRARVQLIDGREREGTIRFVAATADERTRTFRVEIELANPDGGIKDGTTAEVRLPIAELRAHRVPPAILSLADDGRVGVKLVDANAEVAFAPVRVLGSAADGVWVTGLPETATAIVVGYEFVTPGQKVTVSLGAGS